MLTVLSHLESQLLCGYSSVSPEQRNPGGFHEPDQHHPPAPDRRTASRGVDLARGAPQLGAPARSAPTHRRRRRGDEASGLTLAPALAHPGHPPRPEAEIDPAIPPAGSIR